MHRIGNEEDDSQHDPQHFLPWDVVRPICTCHLSSSSQLLLFLFTTTFATIDHHQTQKSFASSCLSYINHTFSFLHYLPVCQAHRLSNPPASEALDEEKVHLAGSIKMSLLPSALRMSNQTHESLQFVAPLILQATAT